MRRAQRRKYHYLYRTTCKNNEKYYIGIHSTDNLNDGYLGSGKRLNYSLNKYGKENHVCEKLEFFESREMLRKQEINIVNKDLLLDPLCMNLKTGGDGGFSSKEHQLKCSLAGAKKGGYAGGAALREQLKDEDFRKKFSKIRSDASKGNKNWIGKKHSKKSIEKMKLTHRGKHIGEKNSQFGTCWITNEKENKKIYKGDLIPEGWRLGRKMEIVKIKNEKLK